MQIDRALLVGTRWQGLDAATSSLDPSEHLLLVVFFCFDFVIDLVEQCATDELLCPLDLGVHEINFRTERPD
jgi:hypothetical protein